MPLMSPNLRGRPWRQLHVEHRPDHDLEAALRSAERAVQTAMGYKVALLEKPLYHI